MTGGRTLFLDSNSETTTERGDSMKYLFVSYSPCVSDVVKLEVPNKSSIPNTERSAPEEIRKSRLLG